MTTLAFQAGVAELEAGESGFDPTMILEDRATPIGDDVSVMTWTEFIGRGFDRDKYRNVKFAFDPGSGDQYDASDFIIDDQRWYGVNFVGSGEMDGLYGDFIDGVTDTPQWVKHVNEVRKEFYVRGSDTDSIYYGEDGFNRGDLVYAAESAMSYSWWKWWGDDVYIERIHNGSVWDIDMGNIAGRTKDNIFDSIGRFFGSITDGFGMLLNVLTFNFYPAVNLPAALIWVPFLMALPVWVYVTLLVMPLAISAVQAIGNLIPFT